MLQGLLRLMLLLRQVGKEEMRASDLKGGRHIVKPLQSCLDV
jgi:hypothetical protein